MFLQPYVFMQYFTSRKTSLATKIKVEKYVLQCCQANIIVQERQLAWSRKFKCDIFYLENTLLNFKTTTTSLIFSCNPTSTARNM